MGAEPAHARYGGAPGDLLNIRRLDVDVQKHSMRRMLPPNRAPVRRFLLALAVLTSPLSLPALFTGCSSTTPPPASCPEECLRAVSCVEACGDEPVQSGCCPCPEGTFDDNTCDKDAGDGG